MEKQRGVGRRRIGLDQFVGIIHMEVKLRLCFFCNKHGGNKSYDDKKFFHCGSVLICLIIDVFIALHLLELLHIFIDAVQFRGDVDFLWAVLGALVAADTVTCLTHGWDVAVVADEETFPRFPKRFRFPIAGWHLALSDAFVVVSKDGRDVQSVRAGHAVVAGGARHGLQLDELLGNAHEEFVLVGSDGSQW